MIRAILLASVAALAFLVSATGPADGAWICKENCDGNVIEVIDGNTLKVQTREFGPIDIDLALVIIPDLNQRDDDEAKYFLNSMCGPVKQISYNLDLKQSDHSMRKLVAEVWCQGQSINELLVESRYAMLDIEKCGTTDFWDKGWAAECRSSIWGDAQTISDIKCPDNKILLEGPNGRPACVEALSASQFLERGYKIVDTANTEDTYGISMNPVEKTNTFINIESSLTILVAVGILMCILIIFIILLLLKNNQGKERTMKTINKELPSTVEINDYEVEERIAKDPIHSTKESRDILPKEKNAVSLSRAAISPHQHQNKSMQNIKKVKPAKEKTRHDMNPKMKLPTAHMQKHMPNAKKSHVMGGNGAILEAFGGGNRDSQETGVVLTSGNISRKLEDEDNIIDNEWLNPYVEYVDELDKIDKKKKNEESGIGSKKIPSQLAKQKNALECTEKINEMINIYKNKFSDKYIGKWIYINKNMHGYEEQQKFVKMALSTPDFAILEGPPGSGKTTVICELIMQLEKNHKSVLVCSSTHVAVDNILEKLVKKLSYPEDKVFRTGVVSDQTKISKKAQKYTENYAINHITKMNPDLDPKLVPDPDLNNLTKHEKYEKKREVNEEKEQRCEKIHEKISQMNLVFSTTMGISR
ncbi:MAG: AAA family ATPase, partial [Alphaproteobacteria bacterium]|nr:AAA family ATPase [Alphaproteobacteria bacterium]